MHENWPNVSAAADDTSNYHLDKRNLIPELENTSLKDGKAQFCDDCYITYRKKKICATWY